MRYSAATPDSRKQMLATIGASSIDDLLKSVPNDVRMQRPLEIAGPMPESTLRHHLDSMKVKQPRAAFVGAGLYPHYIPAPVDSLCARSEWVTSYTPYQAEISQGTLVMYYEFQTYMAMLTGQEIANAGMYDGSTALVEAVLMAMRSKSKYDPVVYVSEALHPDYRAVLDTYMRIVGVELATLPVDRTTGKTILDKDHASQDGAIAVVLQNPNFFGVIEDATGLSPNAFLISNTTEALSMALVKPLPAVISVGDCQSFGIPMQLGGPTAGFFATKRDVKWIRQMPGRLVGRTKDDAGREAFCITLATREQFIRREKATSNICTSSGLMCLRATVYLSLLGRKGLEDLARKNVAVSRWWANALLTLGIPTRFTGHTFNEFVIDCSAKPGLYEKLLEHDIVLGLPLEPRFPDLKHHYLVCATDVHYDKAQALMNEVRDVAKSC